MKEQTPKEHKHKFYGTPNGVVCIECGYSPRLDKLQKQHEAKIKEIREITPKEHKHKFYGTPNGVVCIECGYSPRLDKLQKQHEAKIKEIREITPKEHKHKFYGTPNGVVCIECGYSPRLDKLQKQHEAKIKEIRYEPKKRWLEFVDCTDDKKKTKFFRVNNKYNKQLYDNLGDIKWHTGWRQYVFDDGEVFLAEGCLYEIFEKIKELRLARQKDFDKIVRD